MIIPGLFALASLTILVAAPPGPRPSTPPPAPPRTVISAPPDEDRSPAAAAFIDAYGRAHAARDVHAFEKLVEWTDVTPSMRQALLRSFEADLSQPIQSIYVTPVDPQEVYSFTLHSVTYRPNLEPIRVLNIWFEMPDGGAQRTSYVVGRATDLSYRIAAAAPVP